MSLTPDMMPPWELRKIIDQQADTIARLTEEVERLGRDYNTARDAHDNLLAENERMLKALQETRQMQPRISEALDAASGTIAALTARVAELEGALRWFVDEYDKVQPMRQARVHAPDCRCVLCACDNARTALEGKHE